MVGGPSFGVLVDNGPAMTTAELLPTREFHDCLVRMERAMRSAELLERAGSVGAFTDSRRIEEPPSGPARTLGPVWCLWDGRRRSRLDKSRHPSSR